MSETPPTDVIDVTDAEVLDPPRRTRHDRTGGEWMPVFLASLRKNPSILLAAKTAGISRTTAYNWRERDPAFAAAWDEAREEAIDLIELRGLKLIEEGNPTMIIFYLKSLRPDVYNPTQKLEHATSDTGFNLTVTVVGNRPGDSDVPELADGAAPPALPEAG